MRNIILAALVLFVTGCDENGAIIVGEPITVAPVETETDDTAGEVDDRCNTPVYECWTGTDYNDDGVVGDGRDCKQTRTDIENGDTRLPEC